VTWVLAGRYGRKSEDEDKKGEESYLDLKLLGRVVTYALIVMMVLGLAFLAGIVIWALRRIFGV
jgi:hypothetical protein